MVKMKLGFVAAMVVMSLVGASLVAKECSHKLADLPEVVTSEDQSKFLVWQSSLDDATEKGERVGLETLLILDSIDRCLERHPYNAGTCRQKLAEEMVALRKREDYKRLMARLDAIINETQIVDPAVTAARLEAERKAAEEAREKQDRENFMNGRN
jgi:hypothetical protein